MEYELFDKLVLQLNNEEIIMKKYPKSIIFRNNKYKPDITKKNINTRVGYVTFYGYHGHLLAVKITQEIEFAQRELIANLKLIHYPTDVIVPIIHASRQGNDFILISIGMSSDLYDIKEIERELQIVVSYETILHLIRCISKALFYLDSMQLIHNDIKLENIVFNTKNYMLIDFDAMDKSHDGGTEGMQSLQKLQQKELSIKDDIWSLSIVVYEYVTKRSSPWMHDYDFKQKTQTQAKKNIKYATRYSWTKQQTKFICLLFLKMNQYETKERISLSELLKI